MCGSGLSSFEDGAVLTPAERRLISIVKGYEVLANDLLEIIASLLLESDHASS